MVNVDYEALKEQLLAQGIKLPKLNFCVVNESNQNSQDFISEHFGTEVLRQLPYQKAKFRMKEALSFVRVWKEIS